MNKITMFIISLTFMLLFVAKKMDYSSMFVAIKVAYLQLQMTCVYIITTLNSVQIILGHL